jgi:adenosylcobinamide kinase / adenosylcobinamide-phosphate guanylyltransferase
MSRLTLVTGGSRSGKSRYALEQALAYERRAFIATGVAFDAEMRARIARHRAERADTFTTIEEPLDLAGAMQRAPADSDVILVDCLTVWLGNLMHAGLLIDGHAAPIDDFADALTAPPCDVIVVTNEVGMGIVPEHALARDFRDAAGFLNQRIAALADTVVFTVSGIPITIKAGRLP